MKKKEREIMKDKMKIIIYSLAIIAVIYLLGVSFVLVMKPLRHNWIAWLIFGIYCLNLIFLWAIGGKKMEHHDDREEATKEAQISQELLKDRNKWVV